jgi:hypothetical protein
MKAYLFYGVIFGAGYLAANLIQWKREVDNEDTNVGFVEWMQG